MNDDYRIVLSNLALKDLLAAYQYIAEDSPHHADELVSKILRAVELLRVIPDRQKVLNASQKKTIPVRSVPIPPFIAYFRVIVESHTVQVVTIRHAARRPLKRFD